MQLRNTLLAAAIVLSSCGHRKEASCPALDALAQRDAKADATAAANRGDERLVMVGGFVGELPGGLSHQQVRVLEGTGDTSKSCLKKRRIAFRYARTYNRTILKRQGRTD